MPLARVVIKTIGGKNVAALERDCESTAADLKKSVAEMVAAGLHASEIALVLDGEEMDDSRSLAQHGIEPAADSAQITVLVKMYTLETDEDALRLITKYKGSPNPRDWPAVICGRPRGDCEPAERVTVLRLSKFGRELLPPTIPPQIGQINKLKRLLLDSNSFNGRLPNELRALTCLEQLDLSDNRLEGPLPPWIGDLAGLRRLALQKNRFCGRIPAELGRLAHLRQLFLSDNTFEGPPPDALGQLKDLEELWFDLTGDCALNSDDLEHKLQHLLPDCEIKMQYAGTVARCLDGCISHSLRINRD